MFRHSAAALICLLCAFAAPVRATWSIILVDRESKEVAIGSATCLTSFDLRFNLPVVLVGVGAGAAQSSVDSTGANRAIIWNGLLAQKDPAAILQDLNYVGSQHQTRQYGIVDAFGRAVTFSGTANGAYANGKTGTIGTIAYAIQGNVITGQPVIDMAEAALLNTPGAIPEKLMAAMEAAFDMGGDGRCSCSVRNPTACGSPPATFTKTAHCAFVISARRGDTDGTCVGGNCAGGVYYMNFNIADQSTTDVDPVIQLRGLFDAWRAGLIGVPDAISTTVSITPNKALSGSAAAMTMRIEVRDWQGSAVATPVSVAVSHDAGSAGSTSIGAPSDLGGGVFEVQLTAGASPGLDQFVVECSAAAQTVLLMPAPRVLIQDAAGDLDQDGDVDLSDLGVMLANFGIGGAGDLDGDGDVDLSDLGRMLGSNFAPGF